MKKIIQVFVLVLGILAYSGNIFAQSGTTGPLTWKISNDTLYINGSGAMPDYTFPFLGSPSPWYN